MNQFQEKVFSKQKPDSAGIDRAFSHQGSQGMEFAKHEKLVWCLRDKLGEKGDLLQARAQQKEVTRNQ